MIGGLVMKRLNGWQRLWLVASIALVATCVATSLWTASRTLSTPIWEDGLLSLQIALYSGAFGVAGAALLYGCGLLGAWVRRGFRAEL